MRLAAVAALLFVGLARPQQAIPYFTNVREVHVAQPDRQNYFIVDQDLWAHSRPDLGDLRLYNGDARVQYFLAEQRAGVSSDEIDAKILNLGGVSGHTEFDLDARGLGEYDRVRLRLDAHDFVATASASGGNAAQKAGEVQLTSSILYDFTREQLGSNSVLKLPSSSFRYLHIQLSGPIRPQDVKAATLYNLNQHKASWIKAGDCQVPAQKPQLTTISCNVPDKAPLSRFSFRVASEQVNFRRTVTIEDSNRVQVASGEISRVRINRAGTLVTAENLSVNVPAMSGKIALVIDNADNPPLVTIAAEPQAFEQRVYFEPQGNTALRLYYGDDKLSPPDYDYARFFHLDAAAAQAQLGPGAHNAQYAARPDDRPWSDRHPVILWMAMLIAVAALGALAFEGFRHEKTR